MTKLQECYHVCFHTPTYGKKLIFDNVLINYGMNRIINCDDNSERHRVCWHHEILDDIYDFSLYLRKHDSIL